MLVSITLTVTLKTFERLVLLVFLLFSCECECVGCCWSQTRGVGVVCAIVVSVCMLFGLLFSSPFGAELIFFRPAFSWGFCFLILRQRD